MRVDPLLEVARALFPLAWVLMLAGLVLPLPAHAVH
jgi:hypothetical protein